MSRLTYGMVRDGIVVGALSRALVTCGNCQERCCGIYVTSVEGVEKHKGANGIIFAKVMQMHHPAIGIGCGCYAKAHRQLAHIKSKGG